MLYYFEPSSAKGFRGRSRCTIVTTLDSDIKKTASKLQTFQLSRLRNLEDLQHVRQLAQDRDNWRTIINDIYLVAEAEKSLL